MNYRLNETDLQKMWKYIEKEDFSKRMELLGIEEFIVPDDQSVLMMWLLIGAGVVVSMAMLAFALWRFSCFDDYTRMQAFSDTDSIKAQKRDLDLYPTPHQTLPPLTARTTTNGLISTNSMMMLEWTLEGSPTEVISETTCTTWTTKKKCPITKESETASETTTAMFRNNTSFKIVTHYQKTCLS
ncbi:uncharacterized protein LOC119191367 [Manduca sexta]|uniref:uncharacterized protein LOC119191367 n=1 Tax=Manduca sexta TaxID=7130 RepID=UPI00188DDAA8|nr:uncharacterized protein LOC119191367 [Manduca sexta]